MTTPPEAIAAALGRCRRRICVAAERAGRDPSSVRLVAVSKSQPPEAVRAAAAAGHRVFGESRVQEAQAKAAVCPDGLAWHLIGHLQRNKAKTAARLFDMVHSVDSFRVATALDKARGRHRPEEPLPVLLQVSLVGEASKFGAAPDALPELLDAVRACRHLRAAGLMTIPPFDPDPEAARPLYAALRELRDQLAVGTDDLPELSMGMTNDFEVAVEEGATWVRVGTAVFGPRPECAWEAPAE